MSDEKQQSLDSVESGNNSSSAIPNVDSNQLNCSTLQPVPPSPVMGSIGGCSDKQSPGFSSTTPTDPPAATPTGIGPGMMTDMNSPCHMAPHASPAPPPPAPLTPSSLASSTNPNVMSSGPPTPVGGPPTPGGSATRTSIHSMDSQYMQQQSQIFVFSTQLANNAAEAVHCGAFPSIIHYHCSQPATKEFLDKHPLKIQQFNRQNQPGWMPQRPVGPRAMRNMMHHPNHMQQQHPPMHHQNQFPPPNQNMAMNHYGPPPPGMAPHLNCGPNHPGSGPPWPSEPGPWNSGGQFMGNNPSPRFPNSPMGGPNCAMGPNFNGNANYGPGNFGPGHPHMNQMRQVRADEDLTPQQREHREAKLAQLRQLQQALFESDPQSAGQPPQGINSCGGMMRPPGPDGCPPGMMQSCPDGLKFNPSGPMQGNPSPGGDWGKMQPQFEEKSPSGRRRGGSVASGANTPIPVTSPSSSLVASPNPTRMSSAPPPPYVQGPRPPGIKSPHPASPATGPMSCPLPSPRKQSPADRQSLASSHPYSSPGTPSGPDGMIQGIKFEQTSPTSMNGPRSMRGNPSTSSPADSRKDLSDVKSESGSKFSSLSNSSSSPLTCKNEPQLMPVPSPQHIQYLNSFEGQELTIQKQPNTSLREAELLGSDLDLNFAPAPFPPNSFPSQSPMENGIRYSSPMNSMDGNQMSGPRFQNIHMDQMPPNGGQFCPGDNRFMAPDSMQRMPFDGQHPHRMPHPNDSGMVRGPFPPMDGGGMRFHGHDPYGPGPNRMRGPSGMPPNRFCGPPPNDPMNPHGNFCSSQPITSTGNDTISSTHLQKLQTMAPPFDIGAPPSKMDMNPSNALMSGPQGPQNRGNQFDPLSSMASIANMPDASPGMNSSCGMGGPMTMSSMHSGPNGNTTVNFNTQMNSMQHVNQTQLTSCNNPNNNNPNANGMNAQFGGPMVGGPQTVNNTYVNANLQIQQLNIQGVHPQNYGPNPNMNQGPNPNMNQGMPMHPGPGQMHPHNPHQMAPGQMMPQSISPKMGQNGPRMSSPNSNCSFPPGPPGSMPPRGMPPGSYQTGPNSGPPPQMGPRGPRGSNNFNPNVNQMKPNTIQYHPSGPGPRGPGPNQQQQKGAPNLDFLNYATQLTNLDNKVPTHNLQYFPKDGPNQMPPGNPNIGPPMGPGRPQLIRGGHPGMGPQMMGGNGNFGPDYGRRPPGPHNNNGPPPNAILMPSGPHGPPGNPMYGGPGCPPGSMSPGMGPDSSQPLPPSMAQGGYGGPYGNKQPNFPNSNMPPDPNYE